MKEMMVGRAPTVQSEVDRQRRVLQKASLEELLQSDLFIRSFQLALSLPKDTPELDLLNFLTTLFRQLRTTLTAPGFSSTQSAALSQLVDRIHHDLAPALLPEGDITRFIMAKLNDTKRPIPLRAADTLNSVSRLNEILPSHPTSSSNGPTSLLTPLFLDLVSTGTTQRTQLLALSIIINSIPTAVIPDTLYAEMLGNLNTTDGANIRCSVLANLLSRRREARGHSSEEEKDRYMMEPLLELLVQDRNSVNSQLIDRYLLPAIFKLYPPSVLALLDLLDQDASNTNTRGSVEAFSAWITVAALGVSNHMIDISDLPSSSLNEAMAHADDVIRLRAFQIITNAKNLLDATVLELVKQSFKWNEVLPSASGRTDLASAVHAFFTQLSASQSMARKAAAKDPSKASSLEDVESFHQWFLDDFVNPALGSARRHPAIRAIFILKLLRLYVDIFNDRKALVFTAERVNLLIACQSSEFTEIRSQARQLIDLSPSPMAGYETFNSVQSQALFASASDSLNHPRKTQAEAGRAALCIIFTKIVRDSDNETQSESLQFISGLVEMLERHLALVEKDLAVGIVENPLHGPLSALSDVVSCLQVKSIKIQQIWQAILRHLFVLIKRVWKATRPVISLSSAEGSSAAHEIARAYEVLADGEGDGDDAMDHTNLLSGCWRAVKEAADLLSTILILPIQQGGSDQSIWPIDEIKAGGELFLTWMHEIRHRGTFSRIAPALARLVEVIRAIPDLRPMVVDWLNHELETIASDQHSTTRRSAALPYSVLSIVTGDEELLSKAVDHLVDLARVTNTSSSDVTKVHAMNVLKTVLLDARQTKVLGKYLERGVMVALEAFVSNNWNVRNVGLLLFSTLINRSLNTGRGQDMFHSRTTLIARQTISAWNAKYPSIIPHIKQYLDEARCTIYKSATSTPSIASHSPLFPILNILRSLRWSQEGKAISNELFPLVRPFLGSPEWQVRTVAAQALSSLLSPSTAISELIEITSSIKSNLTTSPNEINGLLLYLHRIISDVLEIGTDRDMKVERGISSILQKRYQAPLNTAAALDCAVVYIHQHSNPLMTLRDTAKIVATQAINNPSQQPGYDLLIQACANTLLIDQEPGAIASALASSSEELRLDVLDRLDQPTTFTPEILSALLAMGISDRNGDLELAQIFNVLSSLPKSNRTIELDKLGQRATKLFQGSRCIPLREASLMVLGWSTTSVDEFSSRAELLAKWINELSHEDKSEPSRSAAVVCLKHIAPFIFTEDPHTSQSVSQISLQKCLLRLLQDDDPDIRVEAGSIVSSNLGLRRPVVQLKALELWWSWLDRRMIAGSDREIWEPWLLELAIAPAIYRQEVARISSSPRDRSGILFEQEPNNIFRDDLVDARFATKTLRLLRQHRPPNEVANDDASLRQTHPLMEELEKEYDQACRRRRRERRQEPGQEQHLEQREYVISPIDDAWDARWPLQQRIDIQRMA